MVLVNDFLTLWWCKSDKHSVETPLRILIFSQASDVQYSNNAGQQWATAPSQAQEHEGEQPILYRMYYR